MKLYKLKIFTLAIVMIGGITYSQNSITEKVYDIDKSKALEDYEILYSTIINYHPNPYMYISKNDFGNYFQSKKSKLSDGLSSLEFHYLCRELIAQIKCGHTFAIPSKEWYNSVSGKNIQLPFDIKIIENKVFISNTTDEEFQFKINDELISINNMKIEDILQKMSSMQERDGLTKSFSNAIVEKRFRRYFLFTYDIQSEYLVEFKTNSGEIKQTTVLPSNKKLKEITPIELPSNFKKILENNWSVLGYDDIKHIAYLKINNFSDHKEYKKYYKSVFKFLENKKDAKLVLDLRDNPGGDFRNGNNFLTFLTPHKFELNFQKPKNIDTKNDHVKMKKWVKWTKVAFALKPSKTKIEGKKTETFTYKPHKHLFSGKINVITNGITFSQAALIAAQLNENGANFFGQETGGTEIGCNGILNYNLVLPNSSIEITIPMYQVKSNSTKGQFGYGVMPHHIILPILDTNTDNTLETVLKVLENKVNTKVTKLKI